VRGAEQAVSLSVFGLHCGRQATDPPSQRRGRGRGGGGGGGGACSYKAWEVRNAPSCTNAVWCMNELGCTCEWFMSHTYVAVCCHVLQCVAVCCSVSDSCHTHMNESCCTCERFMSRTYEWVSTVWMCVAVCCSVLQRVAHAFLCVWHTTIHYNTLQHTVIHCNTCSYSTHSCIHVWHESLLLSHICNKEHCALPALL